MLGGDVMERNNVGQYGCTLLIVARCWFGLIIENGMVTEVVVRIGGVRNIIIHGGRGVSVGIRSEVLVGVMVGGWLVGAVIDGFICNFIGVVLMDHVVMVDRQNVVLYGMGFDKGDDTVRDGK
jgi:hypothetical protein